jgi:hypothetical protein
MALSTLAAVCENRTYGTLARKKSGLGTTLGEITECVMQKIFD